jgi:hypothetical protein
MDKKISELEVDELGIKRQFWTLIQAIITELKIK